MSAQLGLSGYGQSMMAEENGTPLGFITFHLLPMIGRHQANFGIIDQVHVEALSSAGRSELLAAVLVSMKEQGTIAAVKLRCGDYPRGLFFRRGWLFRPTESIAIMTWADAPPKVPRVRNMHVLWR